MNSDLPLVLAAEDEETDVLILRLAFEKAQIKNPLVIVRDGAEAVAYLTRCAANGEQTNGHTLPSLLLLDLKMPHMNGLEVLAWLKSWPQSRDLPAVILSSSPDALDVRRAMQMGARDYFIKPHDLAQYAGILQKLSTQWLSWQR
jgi:two-component system response regulator